VPEVLLSGDHAKIRRWRDREALRATLEKRPDLLERPQVLAALTAEQKRELTELGGRLPARPHPLTPSPEGEGE
jgi:tRNA (guanine37-N1)-methyltransferase